MRWWSVCVMIMLVSSGCWAASTSQVAEARVEVLSVFELSLDRSDIDFGVMKPGQVQADIPAQGIRVTTKSNTGKPWMLKINALSELRSNDAIIPNKNFTWYGWTEGQGRWFGRGDDALTLTPVVAYASSDAEGRNMPDGTVNVFKFKLGVPKDQPVGNYEAVVRFTLTE